MGNLPGGVSGYAEAMGRAEKEYRAEARRHRLQELINSCGKPVDFMREVERRLRSRPELAEGLKSTQDPSYVSRMLYPAGKKGRRGIGEDTARGLEMLFGKPRGWMDSLETRSEPWPFGFSRDRWDALTHEEQMEIERALELQIDGALSRHPSARQKRRGNG